MQNSQNQHYSSSKFRRKYYQIQVTNPGIFNFDFIFLKTNLAKAQNFLAQNIGINK
jgi:hypothetical protein